MQQLLEQITQNYKIEPIQSIEPVQVGIMAVNHILHTANHKYFLKSYRHATPEAISKVHQVMNYFSENGVAAVLPIKLKTGQTYFVHENVVNAVFPFVTGQVIKRETLNLDQAKVLGESLANIHLTTKDGIPTKFKDLVKIKKSQETRAQNNQNIQKIIVDIPNRTEFDNHMLELVKLKAKLLEQHWDTYSKMELPNNALIHGDFHCENVMFDENKITHILDFDNTRIDSREWELARSMFLTFFESSFADHHIESAKYYIKAYASLYPFNFEDFSNAIKFYFFGLFRTVWAEEDYYKNNNYKVKPILSTWYLKLEYLNTNLESFISNLINFA
ncbi:MAG TPA: phosphotransferase [Candidatus Saccharimonadales bacterium]|nr:phosphotransferase [Candidatus Saccharimonadales bacterium]